VLLPGVSLPLQLPPSGERLLRAILAEKPPCTGLFAFATELEAADGEPAVAPVGCTAQVVRCRRQRSRDGREFWSLVARGRQRVRILLSRGAPLGEVVVDHNGGGDRLPRNLADGACAWGPRDGGAAFDPPRLARLAAAAAARLMPLEAAAFEARWRCCCWAHAAAVRCRCRCRRARRPPHS
jgi:hypothetical protein